MMKLSVKSIFVALLFLVSSKTLDAQTTASLSINTQVQGNRIARDQIKLLPPGGQVIYHVNNGNGHLYLDNNVQLANTYLTSPPTNSSVRALDQGLKPGTIKGGHSVDLSGAFNYNIPIQLPPGTNNMVPTLGLAYNSNMGEHNMGIGWEITGLSSITRISKNIFPDGIKGGVEFNLTGPFALDGNRLAYQGTNANSENYFYTESETFSLITLKNQNTQNPYFEVRTKKGLTMIYGSNSDSRGGIPFTGRTLPACGGTTTWYLSKVIDNFGNYMEYSYHNSGTASLGSDVAIKEIKYTGNSSAGLTPYNSVKFFYNLRGNPYKQYFQGDQIDRKLILREIAVYSEASTLIPVFAYKFNYSTGDFDYLNEIVFSGKNGERLNSTAFIYGSPPSSRVGVGLCNLPLNADYSAADLNGDGLSDLVAFIYNAGATDITFGTKKYTEFRVYINDGPIGTSQTFTLKQTVTENFTFSNFTNTYLGITPVKDGFLLADVLGDEVPEIIYSTVSGSNLNQVLVKQFNPGTNHFEDALYAPQPFQIRNATVSSGQSLSLALGDFDSDGKVELVSFWKGGGNTYELKYMDFNDNVSFSRTDSDIAQLQVVDAQSNAYSMWQFSSFSAFDFDGDGNTELIGNLTGGNNISVIKVNLGGSTLAWTELYRTSVSLSHSMAGDYNGDGYIDFAIEAMTHLNMTYGTGINMTSPALFANYNRHVDIKRVSMDINSDGKSDIVELYSNASTNQIEINVCLGSRLANSFFNVGSIPNFRMPLNKDDEKTATNTDDRDYDGVPGGSGDFYSANAMDIPMYEVGDFNGDGNADLLMKVMPFSGVGSSEIRVIYFNKLANEKYLLDVYDGNNTRLHVDYFPLSNTSLLSTNPVPGCYGAGYTKSSSSSTFPLTNATAPINVVSYVSDLSKGQNEGNREAYEYANAVRHVNGRGFVGFDKIIKKTRIFPASLDVFQSTQEYSVDGTYFVRKPTQAKEEFLSPSGNKIFSTTSFGANVHGYSTLSTSRYFSEVNTITSLNNYINSTTIKSFSYDYNNGNLVTESSNVGPGIEVKQVTYSNFMNAGSWLNNVPQNETSTISKAGESTFTRTKSFVYDASKGSLLSSTDGGSSASAVMTSYLPDPNTGVVKQLSKSAPNDASIAAMDVTYDYDSKSRFVEKSTEVNFGYVTETKHEPVYGKPLFKKDFNGLITRYSYDNFGSVTEEEYADGTKTKYYYDWFNPGFTDPLDPKPVSATEALFINRIEHADGKKETSVLDIYGRLLKTETNTFNNGKISSLMTYNNKGELYKEYGPYLIPLPSGKVVLEKTNTYAPDIGQLVSQQATDGSATSITTSRTFNFSTTFKEASITTTGADGKTKTETADETGRLIKVLDNNAGLLEYEYHYDGVNFINLTKLNGVTILTKKTDNFNHLVEEIEPNSGTKKYTINAFGQLKLMTDNKNTQYLYSYDPLGRLTTKSIGPDQYNYTYNNSGLGTGEISEVNINNSNAYKYTYDDLNRLKQFEESFDGKSFISKYEYDELSRLIKKTSPNNFSTINEYANGDLIKIKNGLTNSTIWQLDELDNSGSVRKYTLGNSIQTVKNYDNFGFATGSQSGIVQNQIYNYNVFNGNLNFVTDNVTGNTESYGYDNLDRLETITNSFYGGSIGITYDGTGNITSKYDAGVYSYHGTRYNQALTATNSSGHINPVQQDVNYNLFDKATYIQEDIHSADIFYGPDQNRYKTVFSTNSAVTNTRYYLSGMERNIDAANVVTDVNYVESPTGLCAIQVSPSNGASSIYYTYTDFQGSIVAATDVSGNVIATQSFDAWGRRRDPLTHSYTSITSVPTWLTRGYTGHEHLPQFTLINMNGRMYDPVLGRMLSVDPVLADATNSQDYNKYTYARNNPLKYSDPSGNVAALIIGIGVSMAATIAGAAVYSNANPSSPIPGPAGNQAAASAQYYNTTYNSRIPMSGANTGPGKNDVTYWGDEIVYSSRVRDVWHEPVDEIVQVYDDWYMARSDNAVVKHHPGYETQETEISTYYLPGGGDDPPKTGQTFSSFLNKTVNSPFANKLVNASGTASGYGGVGAGGYALKFQKQFVLRDFAYQKGVHVGLDVAGRNLRFVNSLRATGNVFAVIGTLTDVYGLINYSLGNRDEQRFHVVHPVKFGMNLTATGIGFLGPEGYILSGLYFLNDQISNSPRIGCSNCPRFNPYIMRQDNLKPRFK